MPLRLPQPTRFALVGAINTAITLGVIALLLALGLNGYLANLAGYVCGFANSYLMNRKFTFRAANPANLPETARFAASLGIAYIANLVVLMLAHKLVDMPELAVQAAAMAVYTLVFYYLSSRLVFARTPR